VITLVSAPTNLGLRPPSLNREPGTAKAPEALRKAGLFRQFVEIGATDGGVIRPAQYVAATRPGHLRNEAGIIEHARKLARRLSEIVDGGDAPLVVGGDCSLLIAAGLALAPDRAGLIHIDGHTDFRHPGNSDACASLAGEDLAAAVGLHWAAISDIDGLGPYFDSAHVAHIGCRDDDDELAEATAMLGSVIPASEVIRVGGDACARRAAAVAGDQGFWLHLDVDVLDPQWMPAVDSPDSGGLSPDQLVGLLARLAPLARGAEITVFDPDLDPDGRYAELVTEIAIAGLEGLGSSLPGG
jgi:arginase